jgi:hypothetical protein
LNTNVNKYHHKSGIYGMRPKKEFGHAKQVELAVLHVVGWASAKVVPAPSCLHCLFGLRHSLSLLSMWQA